MKTPFKKEDEKLIFSFYKIDEIEKLSVVEINKPVSFDVLHNPIENGLHDRRMGPIFQDIKCITCDMNKVYCSGHYGHINFPIPIFNPLSFDTLFIIIKNICISCNKLILPIYLREEIENKYDLLLKEYGITEIKDNYINNIKFNDKSDNIMSNLLLKNCVFCNNKPKKYKKNRNCVLFENDKMVIPNDLKLILINVFKTDYKIIRCIFNHNDVDMFFIEKMLVIPNKFRPLNSLNGKMFENFHNWSLILILKNIVLYNEQKEILNLMQSGEYQEQINKKQKKDTKPKTIESQTTWLIEIIKMLQFSTACYFHIKSPGQTSDNSIKNVLERKEGLFRQNLMGKRVNYAGRSVIIPDPNLEPREVGIPLVFAKKLSFKENVTPYNISYLKKLIINGVHNYPGANFVEENGIMKNLKFIPFQERKLISANLLIGKKSVHRQMKNGDVVLLNRQPTLHKPSLMAHTVRILNERVIRLHYSNCSAYNADFDGDEMNIHFLQDHLSRSEAYMLCSVDDNYFNTNYKPVAGLIQDHIVISQQLTLKNKLLTSEEFKYLINVKFNISAWEKEIPESPIKIPNPSILRPLKLYSGKQIFSTIFDNLNFKFNYKQYNKYKNLLDDKQEEIVLIKNGILLSGLIDKSQLGASPDSFVHIIGEIYGFDKAGNLLSIFSRVLNRLLIKEGYTFSIMDFKLTKEAEKKRNEIYKKGIEIIINKIKKDDNNKYTEIEQKRDINDLSSQILNVIQNQSINKFPYNNFANIIQSGAKGSTVNLSHIMGLLGQQELEGQRVKLSSNGYTLPMFRNIFPFSRGHIFGRFLTGLAPHEYFFHSMAGREGLIDTAIKTATSGYLQRCLMKNLEGIKVEYDQTVRYSKGIIQFQYYDNYIRDLKNLDYNQIKGKGKKYIIENLKVNPGENVGALCAQSLGEPSTQMTLNTFHLAGVGGLNVTLGMPRLKELIMSALKTKTVLLNLPLNINNEINKNKLVQFMQRYNKQTMKNIINKLIIIEENKPNAAKSQFIIKFELKEEIEFDKISKFEKNFLSLIHKKAKSASLDIKMKKQKSDSNVNINEETDEILNPEKEDISNEYISSEEDISKEEESYICSDDQEKEEMKRTISINEIDEELKKHFNKTLKEFEIKFSLSSTDKILPVSLIESIIETLVIKDFGVSRILKNQDIMFFEESNYISVMKIFQNAKQNTEISSNKNLFDLLNINLIVANDVKTTLEFLGIEAARIVLLSEIKKVFEGYGIKIDIRHLLLLVDFMTQRGEYLGANRFHIDESLLQKISFESAYKGIKKATVFMEEDMLKNPSSLITIGKKFKGGTGCVELEYDYNAI